MFESSRKIKQIEIMPEGDTILVIWLKLLLLAGNINDGGAIYLTPEIPYTEEMLAHELRRPLSTVRMALSVFERFGMIEIIDDILHLSSWERYQNIDGLDKIREQTRQRVANHRKKQKELGCNVTRNANVTLCNAIEEEREEDKEEDKEYSFIHSDDQIHSMMGKLGQGVVKLSDEQIDSLLELLSLEEFNHYVSVIAECELNGKSFKRKTHYQAILDMVSKDRKTVKKG
jgi:predicted phage replisome organizer